MRDSEFKIEELNPFLEWHLHGSATSQEHALHRAQDICRQIGRPVRILTATNKLVAQFDPSEELSTKKMNQSPNISEHISHGKSQKLNN